MIGTHGLICRELKPPTRIGLVLSCLIYHERSENDERSEPLLGLGQSFYFFKYFCTTVVRGELAHESEVGLLIDL